MTKKKTGNPILLSQDLPKTNVIVGKMPITDRGPTLNEFPLRAVDATGQWRTVDATELTDTSFKRFVLDKLVYLQERTNVSLVNHIERDREEPYRTEKIFE